MSWGTELWDQYENLSLHTQKGIEFLERYGHFIRDRCTIEVEYAAKLRRLVKSYQPKKKEEEDYQYSPCRAFKLELNEVNDQAGQRELIAENLQANVLRELNILVKDFKEDRKKHLQEGARLMASLAGQIGNLERARKAYEKAFREAERALDNYQRADADLNLSRAEVEKQRMNMTVKTQQCEEAKTEYANQLQKTNDMQTLHYHTAMPDVFQHLQELDEKRVKNMRNYMMKSVAIERAVAPIIEQCLDGIEKAANEINEKEDTLLVIERYKSGFQPPGDFPFEDLSAAKSYDSNSQLSQPVMQPIHNHLTVKGTVSGGKIKKRVGLFGIFSSNKKLIEVCIALKNNVPGYGDGAKEDCSDLPPNQRKKRLQQRIDEIQAKIQQETAARDGLMKMKGVYEQNPALGDPMSIEGQLNESSHKLDKLGAELTKFQGYFDEAMRAGLNLSSPSQISRKPTSNGSATRPLSSRRSSHSGGEESLSRSASDSSVSNVNTSQPVHKKSAPGTPQPIHGSTNSPESGLGASRTSLPGSGGEEYYLDELEAQPPLGTCRALYPFDATSEGSIPMYDGEELYMIELDQGDGWTRVRRISQPIEGFVPTSYIECNLYNT
ncbi:formin-binding protein 1-like isoform X1 [Neodiprion pinetum]|uniref:Formin-binding protein 1-like isoform X1 n=1 Tax=Neodiprion lecontei TaxID=441921 RepID=A0A6J0BBH9_NEOLC|nr:formin-binding protein 1-like isoform X1 [Neodiprion lecontei]XP_046412159.1 formin-binding protein 1-like isoform X1 [Neodiprion fabricii]XP_046465546.1 formin-binding protein 1-like isoform X1 [Neodiprion pinetum]XP_046605491.1 formin-binding protein 1-like isoform X1 [Neodiprion virginianus]